MIFSNNTAAALSNSMVYSNLFGTSNMELGQVATSLQNLQQNIEQLIPALTSLSGTAGNTAGTTTPVNTSVANPSTQPPLVNTAPAQNGTRVSPILPQSPMIQPNGTVQNNTAQANGQVASTLGTAGFQTDPQTIQLLTALRNNLQQALPIIQSLNSSSSTAQSSVVPGTSVQTLTPTGFTNRFNRILQQQDVNTVIPGNQ